MVDVSFFSKFNGESVKVSKDDGKVIIRWWKFFNGVLQNHIDTFSSREIHTWKKYWILFLITLAFITLIVIYGRFFFVM